MCGAQAVKFTPPFTTGVVPITLVPLSGHQWASHVSVRVALEGRASTKRGVFEAREIHVKWNSS